jgi:transposase, IS5 family
VLLQESLCKPVLAASFATSAAGDPALDDRFGPLLDLALRVCHQSTASAAQGLIAARPGVQCKRQGQGALPVRVQGLDRDPATPSVPIADLEKLTVAVRRIHGDKGYRGYNRPDRFKVWISGQIRRVTQVIWRERREV